MATSNVQALINVYRPIRGRFQEVRQELAALEAAGVVGQEAELRKQLLAAMVPEWPYRWDESHTAIKRKKGLFGYELQVGPGVVDVPDDAVPTAKPWLTPGRRQVLTVVAAAAVSLAAGALPRGCEFPSPTPTPPGPAPKPTPTPGPAVVDGSDAYKAGYKYARETLMPGFGAAFVETGGKAMDAAEPGPANEALKADHVARLRAAVGAGGGAVSKLLSDVIPPGTEASAVTIEQKRRYADVFKEFGAGIKKAAE